MSESLRVSRILSDRPALRMRPRPSGSQPCEEQEQRTRQAELLVSAPDAGLLSLWRVSALLSACEGPQHCSAPVQVLNSFTHAHTKQNVAAVSRPALSAHGSGCL